MIRINLLGQARPKATKQAVPLEATVQILLAACARPSRRRLLASPIIQQKRQLDETNAGSPRFEPRRPACSR